MLAVIAVAAQSRGGDVPGIFERYVSAAAEDGQINGCALVAENGRILWRRNFGYADIGRKKPITDATLFPLASISKEFTAMAVLQLSEQGKLRLDDPLVRYLKSFPYVDITIRQLLSHTSGLPDADPVFEPLIASDRNRIIGLDDVLPAVIAYQSAHAARFNPGEKWSYSSLGYSLLAVLTQQVSGMPFAEYLRKNILLPAGMDDSYVQTRLAQEAESNRTVNYLYNNHYEMKLEEADKLPDKREWTYNTSGLPGGGGVVSSAGDLFKFDQALYSDVLLKRETLEEAFTPAKLANGQDNQAVQDSAYGLGWFIMRSLSGGKIVWHSGSYPGVVTLYARNLDTQQCFVVLLNVACSYGVYSDLVDIIKGQPLVYRPSLGFLYGHDLFFRGPDYAACHLNERRNDSVHYSLKESEIARIGLEFSRVRNLGSLSREAYKMNILLFPESSQAYEDYADSLKRAGLKDAAILAYRQSLALNPANAEAREKLRSLSSL